MRLCSLSPRLSDEQLPSASNFVQILFMPPAAESYFGLMSDFPLLDFLICLATLTTKLGFLWTFATCMDTRLVTAMLMQLEEGLRVLSGLFSELDPLRKRG